MRLVVILREPILIEMEKYMNKTTSKSKTLYIITDGKSEKTFK